MRACRAALAILRSLPEVNKSWEPRLGEPVRLGIGINTGQAQVGNVGSRLKFKYGALGTTVNLAGWRVTAGFSFTFSNVSLPPGGYIVVAADTNQFRTNFPTVTNVVGNWIGSLNNNSENINIKDAAGNLVNSVTYADNGDWAVRKRGDLDLGHRGWEWHKPHDGHGSSLELINPNLPNDVGENWAASATLNGTPGRANSVNTNNIAPLIFDVSHFPTIPKSTEQITVSARILDEAASGYAVNLFWRWKALCANDRKACAILKFKLAPLKLKPNDAKF